MSAKERIQLAENLWNCGKKTEAFQAALNCIAFVSNGIHGFGKNFLIIDKRQAALVKSQQELAQNDKELSSYVTALTVRVQELEKRLGIGPTDEGDEWKKGGG